MKKAKNAIRMALRAGYVLAITASLTFGFGALQTVRADHCPNDGYTWLGDCADEFECDVACNLAGGFSGDCRFNGCCMCSQ